MLSLAMTVTRLERFLRESGLMPSALATRAGISRQHLSRLRKGTAEPSRAVMVKLALAASAIRSRRVFIVEMFELSESEDAAYQLMVVARFILGTMPIGVSSPHER